MEQINTGGAHSGVYPVYELYAAYCRAAMREGWTALDLESFLDVVRVVNYYWDDD